MEETFIKINVFFAKIRLCTWCHNGYYRKNKTLFLQICAKKNQTNYCRRWPCTKRTSQTHGKMIISSNTDNIGFDEAHALAIAYTCLANQGSL